MITSNDDDVSGQIIGGDYLMCRIVYDGRPQGDFIARTEREARDRAKYMIEQKIVDCGSAAVHIYPQDKWELRIAD